jgi:hypothetical protein
MLHMSSAGGPQLLPGLPTHPHHSTAKHASGRHPTHADTLSPAEQHYCMCELGLSALQLQTFLAQLSGRADVSDDFFQSLSLETVVRRCKSILNPQDSDERRACFLRRLNLIEVFLQHDLGDGKEGRAPVTTAADAASPVSQKPPVTTPFSAAAPTCEAAALVRVLKADWHLLRNRAGPPPQSFGTNALHLAVNQAIHDSSVLNQTCFSCTPIQIKEEAPGQLHWDCMYHCQNAFI